LQKFGIVSRDRRHIVKMFVIAQIIGWAEIRAYLRLRKLCSRRCLKWSMLFGQLTTFDVRYTIINNTSNTLARHAFITFRISKFNRSWTRSFAIFEASDLDNLENELGDLFALVTYNQL